MKKRMHYRKLITLGCMILIVWGCKMYFKTTTDKITIKETSKSLANGKNLVFSICAGCHYNPSQGKFTGKALNDLPKIAGQLYSANLTHSASDGATLQYTDAELFYLLKTGISRSGKFMPYMMKPMMADADVNDIIVYLRSNDKALDPADTTAGKTRINLIGKIGIRHFTAPQPYNKGVERPDEDNPVVYGRYLVGIIGCYHCHSAKTNGLDFLDPEKSKGYLQGGMKLKGPGGKHLYSPNLTFDTETGIGNYTKEEFRVATRDGLTPSGSKLSPPMDKFKALSDKQTDAIYAYLKSLPPVRHKVRMKG